MVVFSPFGDAWLLLNIVKLLLLVSLTSIQHLNDVM